MVTKPIPEGKLAMYNYTAYDDATVNRKIAEDLYYIAEGILDAVNGNVKSILLTGGFGKAEGSVVFESGCIRSINDYDILLVVRRPRTFLESCRSVLSESALRLAHELEIKQVDIAVVSMWHLLLPGCSVVRYENKFGHRVLAGSSRVLINALPANRIPIIEGTKYFRTRGSGLIITRLLIDGVGNFNSKTRYENAVSELNKAGLAIGDAALIARRQYQYSYQKRRETVIRADCSVCPLTADEISFYQRSVDWKLKPNFDEYADKDLSDVWFEVTALFLNFFRRFEADRLGKSFHNWRPYCEHVTSLSSSETRRRPGWLSLPIQSETRSGRMRAVMLYLLNSYLEKNDTSLRAGEELLGLQPVSREWDKRWQHLAKAFLRVWHLEGVVRQLVSLNT